MKLLKPPYPTILSIMKEQKIDPSAKYRRTIFLLEVPCESGALLYHTLTGELILLEGKETAEAFKEALTKAWFFVPEAYDEQKAALEIREVVRLLQQNDGTRTDFTILPTTDCNARCFYCYELGRNRMPMAEKTAHDVASYIQRVSGGKGVKLHWFGGEPLYNAAAIDVITHDLRMNGVLFRSRMTSNGYLFDEETVRKAKNDWNLRKVQITLDGTKDVYNRTKAYINRDPDAYERVLENMERLLEAGVRVTIRLNLDRNNAENLTALAAELGEWFSNDPRPDVYLHQLDDYNGNVRPFSKEEDAIQAYQTIRDILKNAGLWKRSKLTDTVSVNYCMADNDAAEMILPDGSVGVCEQHTESELIGSIYDDRRDQAVKDSWKKLFSPEDACDHCPLFPKCFKPAKCERSLFGCTALERAILTDEMIDAIRQAASLSH